jgi:uncharacterized membrane protein SirB2
MSLESLSWLMLWTTFPVLSLRWAGWFWTRFLCGIFFIVFGGTMMLAAMLHQSESVIIAVVQPLIAVGSWATAFYIIVEDKL